MDNVERILRITSFVASSLQFVTVAATKQKKKAAVWGMITILYAGALAIACQQDEDEKEDEE